MACVDCDPERLSQVLQNNWPSTHCAHFLQQLRFLGTHMAGVNYDPERLSQVLQNNWPEVYARALNVTATLGGFAASIASVSLRLGCTSQMHNIH